MSQDFNESSIKFASTFRIGLTTQVEAMDIYNLCMILVVLLVVCTIALPHKDMRKNPPES